MQWEDVNKKIGQHPEKKMNKGGVRIWQGGHAREGGALK